MLHIYIYIHTQCLSNGTFDAVSWLHGPRLVSRRVQNELHGYLKSTRRYSETAILSYADAKIGFCLFPKLLRFETMRPPLLWFSAAIFLCPSIASTSCEYLRQLHQEFSARQWSAKWQHSNINMFHKDCGSDILRRHGASVQKHSKPGKDHVA